jgi:drug/metabolite transporter (DMT)-like permease
VLRNPAGFRSRMRGRWHLALGVGLLSPLSYILVLLALDMGAPLSVVAPAREMSMMVGALLGMVVLKEAVGVGRIAGCAVLVVGVILLGQGCSGDSDEKGRSGGAASLHGGVSNRAPEGDCAALWQISP